MFYDNLILSGTKIQFATENNYNRFYDNLILSGTKIRVNEFGRKLKFYDNLILSGTKIYQSLNTDLQCFTIT